MTVFFLGKLTTKTTNDTKITYLTLSSRSAPPVLSTAKSVYRRKWTNRLGRSSESLKIIVLNVTSACAKFAWPEWSVYSAAKAGLSMFSRCLYAETRPYGIGVTVIAPGASKTGFQRTANLDDIEWDEANALRPEHVADAAFSVVAQAKGAVIPEIVVYGMEQEIIPF